MDPDLGGKVFDKRSDQKSRMAKGSKERDFGLEDKLYFKTSEDNQNGLMVPLQS